MAVRTENIRRTVLVVEDEFVNSQLLGFILSEEYNVLYAEDGRKALEVLKENVGSISMVLTDIKMPVMDGFELIREIRSDESFGMIPIMVLTSESTYEEKSLDLGAIDFLTKPYDMPSIIKARVRRIIELSEGRNIIKATEKDYLTGLYAREFFFEYASRRETSGHGGMDAVVIDLDRFHVINSLYGRGFGNSVLKAVATSLLPLLGEGDGIACRFENDIFYVLCDHHDSYDSLAEKICSDLKSLSTSIRFSVRIGVLPDVSRETSLLQQFETARSACNSIKSDRHHSVAFYSEEMHKKELLEERLLDEMQKALEEHQFVVWFQPKFNIRGDRPVLCSSEALVRWRHPELGMVSPGVFIPLFERNALISKLDQYVWNQAARQVARCKARYGSSVPVSVNVSRIDLFDTDLKQTMLGIVKENGLEFRDFLLEVTESAYSEDGAQLVGAIRDLRDAGFKIEMDDFGSGYSSLNSLSEMPVDIIKLDMSFTRKIHENKTTLRVVELIVEMAKSLGALVVAEGVETEVQYQLLKQVGCDCVQGYFFSKPLPAAEFEAFIESRIKDLEVRTI
ncbi:MAG: EAL domain-containing protein [Spirochaetales bacterium]|nr:EAL domain-containing protein [Spirochaetales bacterium]